MQKQQLPIDDLFESRSQIELLFGRVAGADDIWLRKIHTLLASGHGVALLLLFTVFTRNSISLEIVKENQIFLYPFVAGLIFSGISAAYGNATNNTLAVHRLADKNHSLAHDIFAKGAFEDKPLPPKLEESVFELQKQSAKLREAAAAGGSAFAGVTAFWIIVSAISFLAGLVMIVTF